MSFPLSQFLQPLLEIAIMVLAGVACEALRRWAVALSAHNKLQIDSAAVAEVQQAVYTVAGIASTMLRQSKLMQHEVSIGSPAIGQFVSMVLDLASTALKQSGFTTEDLEKMLVAQIGALLGERQTPMPAAVTDAANVPAAAPLLATAPPGAAPPAPVPVVLVGDQTKGA